MTSFSDWPQRLPGLSKLPPSYSPQQPFAQHFSASFGVDLGDLHFSSLRDSRCKSAKKASMASLMTHFPAHDFVQRQHDQQRAQYRSSAVNPEAIVPRGKTAEFARALGAAWRVTASDDAETDQCVPSLEAGQPDHSSKQHAVPSLDDLVFPALLQQSDEEAVPATPVLGGTLQTQSARLAHQQDESAGNPLGCQPKNSETSLSHQEQDDHKQEPSALPRVPSIVTQAQSSAKFGAILKRKRRRQHAFSRPHVLEHCKEAKVSAENSGTSEEREHPRLIPMQGQGPSLRNKGGQHIDQYLMRLLHVGVKNAAVSARHHRQETPDKPSQPVAAKHTCPAVSTADQPSQGCFQPLPRAQTLLPSQARADDPPARPAISRHEVPPLAPLPVTGWWPHRQQQPGSSKAAPATAAGVSNVRQLTRKRSHKSVGLPDTCPDGLQKPRHRHTCHLVDGTPGHHDHAGTHGPSGIGRSQAAVSRAEQLRCHLGTETFDQISRLILLQQQQFSSQMFELHRLVHVQQLLTATSLPSAMNQVRRPVAQQAATKPTQPSRGQPLWTLPPYWPSANAWPGTARSLQKDLPRGPAADAAPPGQPLKQPAGALEPALVSAAEATPAREGSSVAAEAPALAPDKSSGSRKVEIMLPASFRTACLIGGAGEPCKLPGPAACHQSSALPMWPHLNTGLSTPEQPSAGAHAPGMHRDEDRGGMLDTACALLPNLAKRQKLIGRLDPIAAHQLHPANCLPMPRPDNLDQAALNRPALQAIPDPRHERMGPWPRPPPDPLSAWYSFHYGSRPGFPSPLPKGPAATGNYLTGDIPLGLPEKQAQKGQAKQGLPVAMTTSNAAVQARSASPRSGPHLEPCRGSSLPDHLLPRRNIAFDGDALNAQLTALPPPALFPHRHISAQGPISAGHPQGLCARRDPQSGVILDARGDTADDHARLQASGNQERGPPDGVHASRPNWTEDAWLQHAGNVACNQLQTQHLQGPQVTPTMQQAVDVHQQQHLALGDRDGGSDDSLRSSASPIAAVPDSHRPA